MTAEYAGIPPDALAKRNDFIRDVGMYPERVLSPDRRAEKALNDAITWAKSLQVGSTMVLGRREEHPSRPL